MKMMYYLEFVSKYYKKKVVSGVINETRFDELIVIEAG